LELEYNRIIDEFNKAAYDYWLLHVYNDTYRCCLPAYPANFCLSCFPSCYQPCTF
jgi:hypothetical protein